jgi:uncharacterized UBP type Zn finger protein
MPAINATECPHIKDIDSALLSVAITACAECGVSSPTRVCLTCGHVGCCESTNGHALAHSRASEQPAHSRVAGLRALVYLVLRLQLLPGTLMRFKPSGS